MDSPKAQKAAAMAMNKLFAERVASPYVISTQQLVTNRDPPVQGPVWVSKFNMPAPPEPDAIDALWSAIQDLRDDAVNDKLERPVYAPQLHAQWTGHRSGVGSKEPEPQLSQHDKYKRLMGETKRDMTIIFIQGGTYVYGSAGTARPLVAQLAAHTNARALTISYRLAPRHVHPAPQLDALVAYLSVLSPAPGSFHAPVPASQIILAGESAGATLQLNVLQTLLHLRRKGLASLRFNGRSVPLDLPAGVSVLSPAADLTRSLPAQTAHVSKDWTHLPAPWLLPNCPVDPAAPWPSSPPRGEIYTHTAALAHPLVSPAAARSWAGSPPLWFGAGQECLGDGGKAVAQLAYSQGVAVRYVEYEEMPHLWYALLRTVPQSGHAMRLCAEACSEMVEGGLRAGATMVGLGKLEARTMNIAALLDMDHEEVLRRMAAARAARLHWVWEGPSEAQPKANM